MKNLDEKIFDSDIKTTVVGTELKTKLINTILTTDY